MNNDFDAVVCVGPQHKKIAVKAIRSLYLNAEPRLIFVLTAIENFSFLKQNLEPNLPIRMVDENQALRDINFLEIKNFLAQRIGSNQRAGWYFQQFLKMSMCHHPDINDLYLLWDSDTILLQPLNFFDHEKVLIKPGTEYHEPYFKTINKLLDIDRQVDYSFISEHMMIKKSLRQFDLSSTP